jgi:predicted nucleic acid-binding protein
MLTYMVDTNICIYVMKKYPLDLREKFNALAEQLCISSMTLGELHYGAKKSARRAENVTAIEHFEARLAALRREGGCALRPNACRTGAGGNALRSTRHSDQRSCAQRRIDRRHQQSTRVRPHARGQS